ncbi:SCO family protein [Roseovarius sp. Pro17]|uniref:SCO family protein n=1 Tax=Roseovarius sp. Pro17 TaxID=3108175 RepID=UPI002D7849FE|nr:SCO family protein [Roseovarius sp. Pro17]
MIDRRTAMMGAAGTMLLGRPSRAQHMHHGFDPTTPQPPSQLLREYQMPTVPLVDQAGTAVDLADELLNSGPVLMTFIFTTCPGICPILSSVVAGTIDMLGTDSTNVRFWSVTIAPDHDGPAELAAYGAMFDAGPEWRLFTGAPEAINAVRVAFDADSDIKMAHRALYLLRIEEDAWARFEGDVTPDDLAAATREVLAT